MIRVCPVCNREMPVFKRKKFNLNKYCSKECCKKGISNSVKLLRVMKPIIKEEDMPKIRIKTCPFCNIEFQSVDRGTFCSDECRDLRANERSSNVRRRHGNLYRSLRVEKIPETDLIWNLNFYAQLVLDNMCHYCGGPLPPIGHGLDRPDSSKGHFCYNVIPCCGSCNGLKGHVISYEEMMILKPGLTEIRKRREHNPGGINYQQIGRPPVKIK